MNYTKLYNYSSNVKVFLNEKYPGNTVGICDIMESMEPLPLGAKWCQVIEIKDGKVDGINAEMYENIKLIFKAFINILEMEDGYLMQLDGTKIPKSEISENDVVEGKFVYNEKTKKWFDYVMKNYKVNWADVNDDEPPEFPPPTPSTISRAELEKERLERLKEKQEKERIEKEEQERERLKIRLPNQDISKLIVNKAKNEIMARLSKIDPIQQTVDKIKELRSEPVNNTKPDVSPKTEVDDSEESLEPVVNTKPDDSEESLEPVVKKDDPKLEKLTMETLLEALGSESSDEEDELPVGLTEEHREMYHKVVDIKRKRFDWILLTKKGKVQIYENPLSYESEYDILSFQDIKYKNIEYMICSNSKKYFDEAVIVFAALDTNLHTPVKTGKCEIPKDVVKKIVSTRNLEMSYKDDKFCKGDPLWWGVETKTAINQVYTELYETYHVYSEWERKNPICDKRFLDELYTNESLQLAAYHNATEGSVVVLDGFSSERITFEEVEEMDNLHAYEEYGIAVGEDHLSFVKFLKHLEEKFSSNKTNKKLKNAIARRPRWCWLRVLSKTKYEYVQVVESHTNIDYFITGEKDLVDWAVNTIEESSLIEKIEIPDCKGSVKMPEEIYNKIFECDNDQLLCIDNKKVYDTDVDMPYVDKAIGICSKKDKYNKSRNLLRKAIYTEFLKRSGVE